MEEGSLQSDRERSEGSEELRSMEEKKSKIPERLQKRNLQRQQELERKKQERESQMVKEEKTSPFNVRFNSEKAAIEKMLESSEEVSKESLAGYFEEVAAKLQELQKLVNDSMMFLPSYDLRQAQEGLQKLQGILGEKREELLPKKRFVFKSRKKEASAPKETKSDDSMDAVALKGADRKALMENISGFFNLDSQLLTKSRDEIDQKDVLLSNLSNCTVKLFGTPSTLHIKDVTNSKVLCGPVSTSIFIDRCSGCVFAFPCQQLRTHNTMETKVYLHVTSRAIIEDCSNVQFAPFNWSYDGIEKDFEVAGLDSTKNNWSDVDDFNWLAFNKQSPNWSILPEEERVSNWD
ncbi:tubulin-specific chaperone C [Latimeria chalumnae]|uniref:Tubulin-specific chaperone C n=1 Tax=Latimeria chalumnae TaxID=7897 RepID=H3BDX1_LATCH|nr:PREDICTED: tubulin-specific chaperone C [Latimeria chalumnae]XP_005989155.1 PREDICTED: tubulin-specific chaperone C [Latimeria chalumnae]|eukprot:XP_005989154.1 PREDICTED: tubulin-specific chaperone C [Latimeria chalumnae]